MPNDTDLTSVSARKGANSNLLAPDPPEDQEKDESASVRGQCILREVTLFGWRAAVWK